MSRTPDIAHRVRAARVAAGLTGREVQRHTGIHPATLSWIETGKQDPSISQLRSLARVLKCPSLLHVGK